MSLRAILCVLLGIRIWLRPLGLGLGLGLGLAAFGPTMRLGVGCISVSAGAAADGFAFTASPFGKRPKGTKGLCPDVRPARWGSGFLPSGIDPGASPTVCFAAPPLDEFGFAKRSLRSHPPDQSLHSACRRALRSRAAAELTLILLSGEKQTRCVFCSCASVGVSLLAMAA
jgi:hypothetical protein